MTRVHHVLLDASAEKALLRHTDREWGGLLKEAVKPHFASAQLRRASPATGYHNVTTVCITVCLTFYLFIAIETERESVGPCWELCGASNVGFELNYWWEERAENVRVSNSEAAGAERRTN